MYNPYDFYFKEAKKKGFKARSVFKLEEIDNKFKIFDQDSRYVLDIGCAPGSWTQFAQMKLKERSKKDFKLIGFDILDFNINLEGVYCYKQDITDVLGVESRLQEHGIEKFDVIISDMAPNTIGFKDIDSIRSIGLLEKTLWIYDKYLKEGGKFAIKVFMGPGFDEFVKDLKTKYGANTIKVFRPKSVRKESKETYVVRHGNRN